MPDRTPFTFAQRKLLSDLVRERPNATRGQIVKIFQARTGRKIHHTTVYAAARGHYDQYNDSGHLNEGERAQLKDLIDESAPNYCWRHIAETFVELTGRKISPAGVAKYGWRLGLPKITPDRRVNPGPRREVSDRRLEEIRTSKFAAAPYRPGYFPKGYRGPDGGDGVRVHRVSGPARGDGGAR